MPPFSIDIHHEPNCCTVHLEGEIDFFASTELTPRLDEIMHELDGNLLFDLQDVTFIDSEGIKAILHAANHMHNSSANVRIIRCNEDVQRVLEMVGADKILDIREQDERQETDYRLQVIEEKNVPVAEVAP